MCFGSPDQVAMVVGVDVVVGKVVVVAVVGGRGSGSRGCEWSDGVAEEGGRRSTSAFGHEVHSLFLVGWFLWWSISPF